jgi:hypothetical protein
MVVYCLDIEEKKCGNECRKKDTSFGTELLRDQSKA